MIRHLHIYLLHIQMQFESYIVQTTNTISSATRPVPQAASVFCVRIEANSSAVSGALGLCDEPHGASDLMGNGVAISPLPGGGV